MADTYSLNKVVLIGHIASDVKAAKVKGKGFKTARFQLATKEVYSHQGKEPTRKTEWHTIVAFGSKAEFASMCKKGDLVTIEGKLRHRVWTNDDGEKRKITEVTIDQIIFMGKKYFQAEKPKEEETEEPEEKEEDEEKGEPF